MGGTRYDPASRMTGAGFARLLARLDPDDARAADAYEQLRRGLEKYFDWHGAWPPDECADEALDRLAKKVDEEAPIEDVRRYAHGIARLLLLEWRRRPRPVTLDVVGDVASAPETADEDPLRTCFDRCLASLPVDSRRLVLEFYADERRAKIDNRRRLARSLAVSDTALRSRVRRVRERIEQCVQACTARSR